MVTKYHFYFNVANYQPLFRFHFLGSYWLAHSLHSTVGIQSWTYLWWWWLGLWSGSWSTAKGSVHHMFSRIPKFSTNLFHEFVFYEVEVFDCDVTHSMLRLDATAKKRYDGKLFKFKKFSIKQAFFINEILSSHVEASKQKKFWSFF